MVMTRHIIHLLIYMCFVSVNITVLMGKAVTIGTFRLILVILVTTEIVIVEKIVLRRILTI